MSKKAIAVVLTMLMILLVVACESKTEPPRSSPGVEISPAPASEPKEVKAEPETSPTSPPRVEILSTSVYTCRENLQRGGRTYEGDFVHIVGEVENVGEVNVKIKSITPEFYDGSGSAIDAPWHRLGVISVLAPDQKAPFFAILLDEDASGRMVDYEFTFDCEVTDEEPLLELELLNSASYMESMTEYDLYWIVGEYENTGVKNIEDVWAFATYYDAEGTVIGYNYAHTPMLTVLPGQKVPFAVSSQEYNIVLELPGDLIHRIASYELGFSYKIAGEAPYREFEILSHRSGLSQEKYLLLDEMRPVFEVQGELKNVGNSQAEIVAVIATFYDADGVVVDACWGHGSGYAGNRISGSLKIDNLSPGETAPFGVRVKGDRALDIADYSLQVACHKISD